MARSNICLCQTRRLREGDEVGDVLNVVQADNVAEVGAGRVLCFQPSRGGLRRSWHCGEGGPRSDTCPCGAAGSALADGEPWVLAAIRGGASRGSVRYPALFV
ncbi:hypothetical protein GOP47_0013678 [Adiantum capillus-veneris]|uniref:Uncharacterized protein n=1 Tax=Adiantum capillus-veneris TaxID=13818 RepID=A0A9D4UPY4_ADICA|nr:hypothetical protein GOP47_0013678 [Adiantum capillus-veneris]